jgi:23S rRNA pseudouridine2605 synthase
VKVNGTTRSNPESPVNVLRDQIEVDAKIVRSTAKTYLVLNKPRGVVTTTSDEKGRDTIYSCLRELASWIAPVGRLDKASEGLLLLTNDSEWAACVTDPATHLDKTYHVQLNVVAEEKLVVALSKGLPMEDGEFLRAKFVRVLRAGTRTSWIEIILDEGKNRQIRRMLERFNVEVLRLVRTAIGPLLLGDLAKGESRPLTLEEKRAIDLAMTSK